MSIPGPIGLDIGTHWIKAVQLHGSTVSAVARLPRREPDKPLSPAEAARIATTLDIAGFVGTEVVLAAPRAAVMSAVLDVPPRTAAVPVGQIARSELARAHRRDPSELETVVWRLPGEPNQALAYGLTHAAAESVIKPLDDAGLEVRAVDLPMSALARAARPLLSTESMARPVDLLVDVGAGCLCIAVVLAGELVYERRIEDMKFARVAEQIQTATTLDTNAITAVLAHAMSAQVPPAVQPLAREIQGILGAFARDIAGEIDVSAQYAATRYPDATPGVVVFVGGAADLFGLTESLSASCKLPVRQATLASVVTCPVPFARFGSMPVLALGLAQYDSAAAPVRHLESAA